MKKTLIIVSMLMVAALVLSACGGANNQNMTPVPGATEPGVGTDFDATPVLEETLPEDDAVVETPVVEDTVELEPTATPEMVTPEAEATPEDGAVVEETPVAGVPVTGDDDCNPYRLQGLLDMDVVDANNEQIGDVDAVIVMRDASAVTLEEGATEDTEALDATPAAGDTVATPAVEAEAGAAEMTGTMVTDAAAPRIAYVVIDLENNDDELLVPMSAFDMTVFDRDVPATTDGTAEDAANEFDTCALTFTSNVTAESMTNAPVWTDDLDLSVEGWDEQYRTYWSEQGVVFNEADFANLGNPVWLGDGFDDIDARNFNDDDLGEVEDFVLNPQTGEFDYAVLATGGFLGIGERYIPVPTNMISWVVDDADDLNDAGYIMIPIADEEWENAPAFDSLDELDASTEGWDEELQSFWNNLTGTQPAE